jgi:hypothetical protein
LFFFLTAGLEFDELPNEARAQAVRGMAVFARVEPSHKQRLVELLKAEVHTRQTARQADRQAGRQADRQTDKQRLVGLLEA